VERPLVSSYRHIHKAIGGELLKLEAHARSVDPNNPESVGGFAGHLGMFTGIQDAHSHEEEQGVWPQIESKLPGLTQTFLFDHEGERKYVADIKSALAELQRGGGDKQDAAARLYRSTVALASHLIHHMAKEEALLYVPFADRLSEQEESKIVYDTYEGLPEEMVVQAMPWWASYQTPEDIVQAAGILERHARPEKARLVTGAVVNSLPPERWAEVQRLGPQLAEFRKQA
jgi:hemerythrin-like domain-containing protein